MIKEVKGGIMVMSYQIENKERYRIIKREPSGNSVVEKYN